MEILDLLRQIVAASKTHPSPKPEVKPDIVNEQGFDGDSEAPVLPAEVSQPQSRASQAGASLKNSQRPVTDDGPTEPDGAPIPPQPTHATPHGLNESYYNSFLPSAFSVRGRDKGPPDQTSSTPEVVFPLPRPAPAIGSMNFPLPHPHHNAPPPHSQAQSPDRPPPFYPHPPALQPWHPYYPPAWPPPPTLGVPIPTTMHDNGYHPLNVPHGTGQNEPFSPLQNPWDSARSSAQSLEDFRVQLRPVRKDNGLYRPLDSRGGRAWRCRGRRARGGLSDLVVGTEPIARPFGDTVSEISVNETLTPEFLGPIVLLLLLAGDGVVIVLADPPDSYEPSQARERDPGRAAVLARCEFSHLRFCGCESVGRRLNSEEGCAVLPPIRRMLQWLCMGNTRTDWVPMEVHEKPR